MERVGEGRASGSHRGGRTGTDMHVQVTCTFRCETPSGRCVCVIVELELVLQQRFIYIVRLNETYW